MNPLETLREFCKDDDTFQSLLWFIQQNDSDSSVNFEKVLQISWDNILITRTDDDLIRYANPTFIKSVNSSLEALRKKTIHEIWTDPAHLQRIQRALIRYGRVDNLELFVNAPDGSRRVVIFSACPIRYQGEECLLSITRDISSIVQTHERLHALESLYEAVVESQAELICRYDTNTNVVFANEAYCKAFNKTLENMLGKSFLHDLSAGQVEYVNQHIQRILSEKQRVTHEMLVQNGTLTGRWIQWTDTPIFDQEGEVFEIQAVGRDITDLKEAERKEFELAVERERVEIMSQFVRNAAHEFYTPLATIETSLHLLEKSTDEERRQRSYDKIRAQTKRLASLVDSLTTMMRISTVTSTESRKVVDFSMLFEMLFGSMKNSFETKNILPILEIPPNHSPYYGFFNDLRGAFRHILENALRHSPENGQIKVTIEDLEQAILIHVYNQGERIPENELERIFETFYRLDNARTTPGLGLGLSIARTIIERQHEGHVYAENAVDGTVIHVRLPIFGV